MNFDFMFCRYEESSSSADSSGSSDSDSSEQEQEEDVWASKANPTKGSSAFIKAVTKFEKFFEVGDGTSRDLTSKYIPVINRGLRAKPSESKCKELIERYTRPANMDNLQVPKTNEDVYELMDKGPIIVDTSVQKNQLLLSKVLIILTQLFEAFDTDTRVMVRDHQEALEDALKMLISCFSGLNQVRKDVIRNNMGYPLSKMCTWEIPVGATKLFDVELGKKIKEKEEARFKLSKKKKFGYVQYSVRMM